jgi:FtsH-binding integral membrane protein
LVYDTQLIAGKGKLKLGVDDYIIGALIIYLDIILLFLELLKICGRK